MIRRLQTDLVIGAKSSLLSFVTVQRTPAAIRLFTATAHHINHALVFVRRTESVLTSGKEYHYFGEEENANTAVSELRSEKSQHARPGTSGAKRKAMMHDSA